MKIEKPDLKQEHEKNDIINKSDLNILEEPKEKYGDYDELTPAQWRRLEESKWQLRNGRWKSHEDVMKILKERPWLKE